MKHLFFFIFIFIYPLLAYSQIIPPPVGQNTKSSQITDNPRPHSENSTSNIIKSKSESLINHWTLGFHYITSVDTKHFFKGGGLYLKYMYNKRWGAELNWIVASGDTSVDEYSERTTHNLSANLIYAITPVKNFGLHYYSKVGFAKLINNYYSEYINYSKEETISYKGLNSAVGLHWNVLRYMSLKAEALVFLPLETVDDKYPSLMLFLSAGIAIQF